MPKSLLEAYAYLAIVIRDTMPYMYLKAQGLRPVLEPHNVLCNSFRVQHGHTRCDPTFVIDNESPPVGYPATRIESCISRICTQIKEK